MQALQVITNSLNDGASLQRLRDALQDMPRMLLSAMEGTADPNYLLGSVTGEYNYHFTFRLEGGGFFQTGVLVAAAERTPGGLPVPLKCRWKRRVGDMAVEIPGVTSNMYQISADDVGTNILVEAQPADSDDGLLGIAIGEIGPFELDPATRRSLDNALGVGSAKFTVQQWRSGDASGTAASRQDLTIHVTTEMVKVTSAGGGREVVAEYSADYPRVIIHPLDTTKFQLVMSESRMFHMVASARTMRDLIALTCRCFHAKKYLSTQQVLQVLLPVQDMVREGPAALTTPPDSRLDACIVLERLTKELNRSMQQKEVSEKMLRNTNNEKKELQAQLMETISGFTEVIESLQDQFEGGAPPPMPAIPAEQLQEQVQEVTRTNKALQEELQGTRRELEHLQKSREAHEAKVASGALAGAGEAQQMREEREILKARLKDLTSNGPQPGAPKDQADQVHMQELRRLRQDVEGLHANKENLRRQLQDQDKERQELQENFLYVKGQLDKVQLKQAQVASGDTKADLRRQEQTLHTVHEERNRLSARLEQVLNELEKEKAYHEQHVERIVSANARIMEEKDRAQLDVQRISQLYADSIKNVGSGHNEDLNQTSASDVFRTDSSALAPWGVGVDEAEVARVRVEVAKMDDALKKREQENESLKNRIRKLAVA